jgi:hypothetical protein
LPSVGKVTLYHPFTGERFEYQMPAGGRGYTRVPSLIGIWSTAPYLLNNSVGPFEYDPSVASRMKSFQASIEQMLWPEKRDQDEKLGSKIPGKIDRTTLRSSLNIPAGYLPQALQPGGIRAFFHTLLPNYVAADGGLILGPIPKGVPVGLLANMQLLPESDDPTAKAAHFLKVSDVVFKLKKDLLTMRGEASDEQLLKNFSDLGQSLLNVSKCPDLIVNKGHYFGTAQFNDQQNLSEDEKAFGQEAVLTDEDKRALIEFLKTF